MAEDEQNPEYYFHPKYTNYGILVYEDTKAVPFRKINDDTVQTLKTIARRCDSYIGVSLKGKPFYYFHRFVLECYLSRELTKEEEVDHIDGDKINNKLDNLDVVTHTANMKKIKTFNYRCYVTDENGNAEEYFSLSDIVMATHIEGPVVSAILSGKILGGCAINNKGEKYWFQREL